MRWMIVGVLSLSVAAGACKEDEPFVADVKMMCGAGDRFGDLPPDLRSVQAARYIAEHVKTPEAARLMSELIQAHPADRAALLAPALKKAKLSRCALLER